MSYVTVFSKWRENGILCCAAHCSSLPLHPVLTRIKLTAKKNEIEISRLKKQYTNIHLASIWGW